MAVTAGPLVETLFGAKWRDMAPLVAILALAMPFMTLQVMFAPVSSALGRPGTTARIAAVGTVLLTGGLPIGLCMGRTGVARSGLFTIPISTHRVQRRVRECSVLTQKLRR